MTPLIAGLGPTEVLIVVVLVVLLIAFVIAKVVKGANRR